MNERKVNLLKRLMLYLVLVAISGCIYKPTVKEAETPHQSFKPSNEESLVFGHLEIFVNGAPFTPDFYTTCFIDMNSLPPKPHQWTVKDISNLKLRHIDSIRPDGYFSVSLPAGKYLFDGVVFEVIPSHAIYIGKIRAFYHTEAYEKRKAPDRFTPRLLDSNLEVAQKLMTLGIGAVAESIAAEKISKIKYFDKVEVESDYEKAKDIFSVLYPNLELTEMLAEPTVRPENIRHK